VLAVIAASDRLKMATALRKPWSATHELAGQVSAILADVRKRGDEALHQFKLRVPIPMAEQAREFVPPEIADALRLAKERIVKFHARQRRADTSYVDEDATRYSTRYRPLESIAICVPAGSCASTVLMCAIPAAIAGVDRVIVLAAPDAIGHVHPAVLYACNLCGVEELYAVSGAHAVAAAAYGTDSIRPVDKIFGNGNASQIEAKRQIVGECEIDRLSSVPEVLVIADEGANSEYVAGELLAQAERDPNARVAVLSESRPLLDAVAQLLDTLDVKTLARGDVIADVMARSCYLIHANSRDELFESVEAFSPDRVSLQVRDAEPYLERLRRASAVFVGDMTPVACGDFLAGTNGEFLTLDDFMRAFSVVENSRERMIADAQALAALSEFEGLPQHAHTARMRNGA
jgi:histidinol dehydrogenase